MPLGCRDRVAWVRLEATRPATEVRHLQKFDMLYHNVLQADYSGGTRHRRLNYGQVLSLWHLRDYRRADEASHQRHGSIVMTVIVNRCSERQQHRVMRSFMASKSLRPA